MILTFMHILGQRPYYSVSLRPSVPFCLSPLLPVQVEQGPSGGGPLPPNVAAAAALGALLDRLNGLKERCGGEARHIMSLYHRQSAPLLRFLRSDDQTAIR